MSSSGRKMLRRKSVYKGDGKEHVRAEVTESGQGRAPSDPQVYQSPAGAIICMQSCASKSLIDANIINQCPLLESQSRDQDVLKPHRVSQCVGNVPVLAVSSDMHWMCRIHFAAYCPYLSMLQCKPEPGAQSRLFALQYMNS